MVSPRLDYGPSGVPSANSDQGETATMSIKNFFKAMFCGCFHTSPPEPPAESHPEPHFELPSEPPSERGAAVEDSHDKQQQGDMELTEFNFGFSGGTQLSPIDEESESEIPPVPENSTRITGTGVSGIASTSSGSRVSPRGRNVIGGMESSHMASGSNTTSRGKDELCPLDLDRPTAHVSRRPSTSDKGKGTTSEGESKHVSFKQFECVGENESDGAQW